MTVRSRRLFGPTGNVTNTNLVVFTVPADRTAVVRSLLVANLHPTTAYTFTLKLDPAGTTGITILIPQQVLPANGVYWLPDELVLNPGDGLILHTPAATPTGLLYASAFGSLLAGVPE